jgi:hypothetical protein
MLDSQDPYLEDRRQLDLAWRLLRHGARTQTISRWTGMSARRVRSLLKKYRARSSDLKIQRPRGDSPFNMELLLRSPRRRVEAALFAAIYRELNPEAGFQSRILKPNLSGGELACVAFEAFRQKSTQSVLSIDQAFLVLSTLSHNVEFSLGKCPSCDAPILVDRLAVVVRRCGSCSATNGSSSPSVEVESKRSTSLSSS